MFYHLSPPIPQPNGNIAMPLAPQYHDYALCTVAPEPNIPGLRSAVSMFFPAEGLLFRTNLYAAVMIPPDFVHPHGGVLMDVHRGVDVPVHRRFRSQLRPATES